MLFIPLARPGDGIGHLRRCIELAHELPTSAILMPEAEEWRERIREVVRSADHPIGEEKLCFDIHSSGPWDLIVLDRRETTRDEARAYSEIAPAVGIDEGGEARDYLTYLIDTLPLPESMSAANFYSPAFQPHPRNKRKSDTPTGRVLIAFGGEDPAGLTPRVTSALVEEQLFAPAQITAVVGPLAKTASLPAGVTLLVAPPNLREELHRYDIVFTSFGLTAYEAVNAGVEVVLVNPTPYHQRLSVIAGFPEAGVGEPNRRSLKGFLEDRTSLTRACRAIATDAHKSIGTYLLDLDFGGPRGCPVCGTLVNRAVGRFPERSYFRCDECGMVYETNHDRNKAQYNRDYFFEEYSRQYGKTYLEDFDNIRRMGAARLDRIRGVMGELRDRRLLDVGCAYGAFLVEAEAAGATSYGIDVSEEAIGYVHDTLHITCARTPFEQLDLSAAFGIEQVDIVTMWYVIEHFPRLDVVLEKVNSMLPRGGVLALATPNLAGVSGTSDFGRFIANSPRDHFTLWDPSISRSVLGRFGFRVAAVNITGHHPERFRVPGAGLGWTQRVLSAYSRFAGLGDTFEVFAVKEGEPRRRGERG